MSTYQRATAGVIGCPSQEIAISGQPATVKSTPIEWRAECRGHRYVCSGSGNVANCKEELQPAFTSAPGPAATRAP